MLNLFRSLTYDSYYCQFGGGGISIIIYSLCYEGHRGSKILK